MSFAYRETYLADAMRNLGEMTEYAHEACRTGINNALRCFVISGLADRFGRGDPSIVSGISGTELYIRVMEKCGIIRKWPDPLIRYETDEHYWVGYIMAMFQWRTGIPYRTIINIIGSEDLYKMYPALHTVSDDRAVDSIADLYQNRSRQSRLQAYRKLAGYTQSSLCETAGVNLRTLQQYEIGSKDIKKASADKVLALSNLLHCYPEDIVL